MYDKELLAIVEYFKTWRYYFKYNIFKVVAPHLKALYYSK